MDEVKNVQSDLRESASDTLAEVKVSETILPQEPTNRLLVPGLFIMLVLLGVVLFFVFRSGSTKNTNSSSPAPKGASGSTGANGNTKNTDTVSPELRLNRPRSVSKPQAPPFKSIDLKNP